MASNSSGEAGGALRGRAEIALIGCNHRTAPLELRERVAFTPEQALRAAKELCDSGAIEEAVVVSTCNRSELYGAGEDCQQGDDQDAGQGMSTVDRGAGVL